MDKEKKVYNGLEAEFISFGEDAMNTATIWHYSGCSVGSMGYYTSDEFDNPMPLGTCWWDGDPDNLDLEWASYGGGVNP